MKLIHNCKTITEALYRMNFLAPYLNEVDAATGEYGIQPFLKPGPSMKPVEDTLTKRFADDNCMRQPPLDCIVNRKLTWMKVEKLSQHGVYFSVLALWGDDLWMVIGRSDWCPRFLRYDQKFS